MDPSLDTVIAATALQAILESPQPSTPPLPPTPRLDRRLPRPRLNKGLGRWALLNSLGKPPTGSYGSVETAIKAVLKRRAARATLMEARRARKEAREAVKAAKAAARAEKARERREAFEVKKAAHARGRADAVKLNETITNRINDSARQREEMEYDK